MKGISRHNLTLTEFEVSVAGVSGGISAEHDARFKERVEILDTAAREIAKSMGEGPLHVGIAHISNVTVGIRGYDKEGVREPKKGVEVAADTPFHKMMRRLD